MHKFGANKPLMCNILVMQQNKKNPGLKKSWLHSFQPVLAIQLINAPAGHLFVLPPTLFLSNAKREPSAFAMLLA